MGTGHPLLPSGTGFPWLPKFTSCEKRVVVSCFSSVRVFKFCDAYLKGLVLRQKKVQGQTRQSAREDLVSKKSKRMVWDIAQG